ncbi:MAG: TonB-dependent receptor [Ferruginibacter sp.]|nr:TonB-dependent receptor [Ferruginibacter sp.]
MRKIIPLFSRTFYVALLLMLSSITAFAQTKVSGRVTNSKDGAPLAGITVSVKGTKSAVQTALDGTYSISVPAGATLVFTSATAPRQEAVVNGRSSIDIVLTPSNQQLEEVIVVGYGTQRKKEVTGAISRVSNAQINATAAPSFEASLQGRVAGVQVSQSSGLAGSGSYVRIRGIASVSAGGDPLYVVDGIPISSDPLALEGNAATNGYKLRSGFTQSPLASINPEDIESIEVLKDAGAAGIYGSRGANGVILITTKRGKLGKPHFNFSTKFGFTRPSVKPDLLNSAEWLQLRQEAYENDGHTGQAILPSGVSWADAQATNTDWFDLLTRTGFTQDYNLSMTYGKNKFKSYLGGTYGTDESYAVGNKFTRATIRGNFDYAFSTKFKAILTTSYNTGLNYRVPAGWAGGIGSALSDALPIYKVYKADGSYDVSHANPLVPIRENMFRSNDQRVLGGLTFIYSPVKNLDLKASGNLDHYLNTTDQYNNNKIYNSTSFNAAERWKTEVNNYNFTGTATYRYEKNSNNIFTFLAGGEYQQAKTQTRNFYRSDSTVNTSFYKNEGLLDKAYVNYPKNFAGISRKDSLIADKWNFISYFGRVNYAYKNKLFLQALARVDGSSKFGTNNKYGFFPAVSAGYVLSDESFMKASLPQLNYLKLRMSYGITGNAAINSFSYTDRWNVGNGASGGGYNGGNVIAQDRVGNPDLKWETANNFDAGFEFGLFKNRLTGEIAYYNKLTKDVLMTVGLEEGFGIGSGKTFYGNIGKIKNNGVELSLNYKLIDRKDMTWSIFANGAHNYNEVTDAGGYAPDAIQSGTNETRVLVGYPVGTSYTIIYKGVDPADGLPMWLDKNGKITKTYPDVTVDGNRRAAGKLIPDWTGGFGTNLKYKGFELNSLFVFSTGLDIWDNSGKKQFLGVSSGVNWNMRREFLDRWTKPGDQTLYPRVVYDKQYPGVPNADGFSSSMFLYKADYLRLRELTLAYNFAPSMLRKMKMNNLRFFVTGTNLFLFTKYKGGDPEVNRDADGGSTDRNMSPNVTYLTAPQAKTIQVGLNLNF